MIIPLSQLSDVHLEALTDLHLAVMPTLLTDLGRSFVLRYYRLAQRDPAVLGFCDESMQGWVIGSPHPAELNARLRESLPWFAGQMLRVAFTRPKVLIQVLRALRESNPANQIAPGEIELTYIGVSETARRAGIGASLLRRFLAASQQAGYQKVSLSVETDNLAAINFYKKHNFFITSTFQEGPYHRHRMVWQVGTWETSTRVSR